MRHLFARWSYVKKRIGNKRIALFLDYDGTLTPIAASPDKAVIPPKIKELLKRLSKNKKCTPVIITGRSLKDIKKKTGLKNIIYAGNHGLQIEGPNIKFRAPVPPHYRIILQKIKKKLNERLSGIKGVLLEDKGLSLSIHYRLVNKKYAPIVKTSFYEVAAPYRKSGKIKTKTGKKVLEIRPAVKWDKGKAVLWLLQRLPAPGSNPFIPVYIGDDSTDEDAFKALKTKGLTILVGRNVKSHAQYYILNSRETLDFISRISEICGNYR